MGALGPGTRVLCFFRRVCVAGLTWLTGGRLGVWWLNLIVLVSGKLRAGRPVCNIMLVQAQYLGTHTTSMLVTPATKSSLNQRRAYTGSHAMQKQSQRSTSFHQATCSSMAQVPATNLPAKTSLMPGNMSS